LLVLPQPWKPKPPWPGRAQPLTLAQVPRHHNLVRLWRLFNDAWPNNGLSDHTVLVRELNRWESIRYAQLFQSGPTVLSPTIEAAEVRRTASASGSQDVFVFDLARLDELFHALLDFAGISRTLRGSKFMVNDAREFHEADNPFAIR